MSDMSEQFAKFAGRQVDLKELEKGNFTPADPAVAELTAAAQAAGYRLRLWLPGSVGTTDVRTDRLNAYVEKAADGAYRIAPRFTLG